MNSSHGSYPFDDTVWNNIWTVAVHEVPMKAVDAFLRDATPDGAVLHHTVPNKEFRVVQQVLSRVVALYNHDGKYALITAYTDEFLKRDRELSAAMKDYRKPGDRLPYLIFP